MSETNDRFKSFREMSTLKKVLIVFVVLLLFIIIVEQPGRDSSGREGGKYFIPRLVAAEVSKISIEKPDSEKVINLENTEGKWRVANGHSFPADEHKIDEFLKVMFNLEQGSMVSKNADRASIFSVDEVNGIHITVWNQKESTVADFYAGELIPNGQYLRHADSDEVYQTIPSLAPFLLENSEGWKDKTLLSLDEKDVKRVALNIKDEEIVIEKKADSEDWTVIQPEEYKADSLAVRTLFEQLKNFKADSFAESIEASQINFEEPDYKISVRLGDDSLESVSISESEDEKYYAKNGDSTFTYVMSKSLVDKIFGLEFKTSESSEEE